MGWVEGWMGIKLVEVGWLIEQVGTQTTSVGLDVVAFSKSKFD